MGRHLERDAEAVVPAQRSASDGPSGRSAGVRAAAWRRVRRTALRPRRADWQVLLRRPAALAVVAVVLRLPGLPAPARPDEAGYLLVAAHAGPGGPYLYGELWVDRPPLLVAFFRVADALGGLLAARLLALAAVVALVLAAAGAGRTLGGARGATWAAAVAAALSATPLLGTTGVNGELLGAPFVMAACAVGLRALRQPAVAGTGLRMTGAGALAAVALLVKQNLADALVLLAVTVAVLALRRELAWRRAVVLVAALAAGAAAPLLLALLWATGWGAGAGVLWDTVIGFRLASADVLDDHTTLPLRRLRMLVAAAVAAGVVPLLVVLGVAAGRRSGDLPTAPAVGVAAMTVTGVVSMALGGSFWLHYLLQLLPAAALAAALLATAAPRTRRVAAGAVALVVASAVVAVASAAPQPWTGGCRTGATASQAVRDWLQPRVRPGDSAVTLYGVSSTLLGTGVRPAYPYLWSLPVRTLDPRLERLLDAVSGPDRATWVVRVLPLRSWGLDRERRLARQLAGAYRPVAQVCGGEVLLRDGLVRPPLRGEPTRRAETDSGPGRMAA